MSRDTEILPLSESNENTGEPVRKKKSFVRVSIPKKRKTESGATKNSQKTIPKSEYVEAELVEDDEDRVHLPEVEDERRSEERRVGKECVP